MLSAGMCCCAVYQFVTYVSSQTVVSKILILHGLLPADYIVFSFYSKNSNKAHTHKLNSPVSEMNCHGQILNVISHLRIRNLNVTFRVDVSILQLVLTPYISQFLHPFLTSSRQLSCLYIFLLFQTATILIFKNTAVI